MSGGRPRSASTASFGSFAPELTGAPLLRLLTASRAPAVLLAATLAAWSPAPARAHDVDVTSVARVFLEQTGGRRVLMELTLVFDRFTVSGRTYSIRATVLQALQGEADTGRVAAGAGVGAIIGGILGGVRGALTGILIGGGGTVAATEGNDVDLPPGTVLRVRLDAALDVAQ